MLADDLRIDRVEVGGETVAGRQSGERGDVAGIAQAVAEHHVVAERLRLGGAAERERDSHGAAEMTDTRHIETPGQDGFFEPVGIERKMPARPNVARTTCISPARRSGTPPSVFPPPARDRTLIEI